MLTRNFDFVCAGRLCLLPVQPSRVCASLVASLVVDWRFAYKALHNTEYMQGVLMYLVLYMQRTPPPE